jgi:hypothetical protein
VLEMSARVADENDIMMYFAIEVKDLYLHWIKDGG